MVRRRTGGRGLFNRKDGTVTILAVIVLSSLLLFFGVLIDYARIAALQLQSEQAARSAARSVMSAYDGGLYERYGLFGRGGTEGADIYAEAIEAQLGEQPAFLKGGFRVVDTKVDHMRLNVSSTLGEHDVFARQVLEEMKYKAPVDFTIELIAKLSSLAPALKESSAAISTLEQLRKLYEQREQLLEEALKLQKQAAEAVNRGDVPAMIPAGMGTMSPKALTAQSITEGMGEYLAQASRESALEEGQTPPDDQWTKAFEIKAAKLTGALSSAGQRLQSDHAEPLSAALRKLEQAEMLNQRMNRALEQANEASAGGYDAVAGSDTPGTELYPSASGQSEELEAIRNSGEQLIRDVDWFRGFRSEIGGQEAALAAITSGIRNFMTSMRTAMSDQSTTSIDAGLAQSLSSLQSSYVRYEAAYINPGSVLQAREAALEEGDVKRLLKEQEAQTQSLWQEAKRLLGGMAGASESPEHRELFRKVEQRYEQNLLFNGHGGLVVGDVGSKSVLANDAHEAANQSASLMDGLFGGMSEMLAQSRDHFYYGEYVAGRFTYFEPRHLRALLENGDTEGLSEAASFQNQEMEYALYGFHNPLGNLIAAYGEVFAVRLAVRMMEGLIESRKLGHPLLILSGAVIYGLGKTMEDMLSLTRKGTAPISKYVKAELSYKDYLRLFMLLHGGRKEERLARMIAVIEQNSGLTLAAVPTGVTGEAAVSMKLWFVPGIMRLLGRFDGLQGKVAGGRYESNQIVGFSY